MLRKAQNFDRKLLKLCEKCIIKAIKDVKKNHGLSKAITFEKFLRFMTNDFKDKSFTIYNGEKISIYRPQEMINMVNTFKMVHLANLTSYQKINQLKNRRLIDSKQVFYYYLIVIQEQEEKY